ncbi:universal stress protein UspE [Shewanella sp. GXUN23E]|uniref:universal stress protein UspE n=1 Tax=Shewanella sp. GXUN23E TaxID=3422498 RepID=UPI003D7CEF73
MREYQKLLVVIDPTTEDQAALARAVELAQHSNAAITVFLSIFDLSYEMTSILSSQEREAMRQGVIDQRTAWLEDIIAPYKSRGLSIDTKVIWHNRPFESIIQFAIEGDYHLIVKATHEHDKLKAIIFTPTDWHLLRKAPMPVLMVKEHEWSKRGKILCAVNVATEDADHDSLNEKIIKHGLDLAKKFNAELHLVNGYPGTPVNLAIELPDFDANNFTASVKMQHEQRVDYLAETFGIDPAHCHVKEGLPEDVIPELATELDAELVILGTIGRTALSAALIGNTAEHVIDSLNCDLLAIKPAGYKSPLATE